MRYLLPCRNPVPDEDIGALHLQYLEYRARYLIGHDEMPANFLVRHLLKYRMVVFRYHEAVPGICPIHVQNSQGEVILINLIGRDGIADNLAEYAAFPYFHFAPRSLAMSSRSAFFTIVPFDLDFSSLFVGVGFFAGISFFCCLSSFGCSLKSASTNCLFGIWNEGISFFSPFDPRLLASLSAMLCSSFSSIVFCGTSNSSPSFSFLGIR